jgi:hypothetical protein
MPGTHPWWRASMWVATAPGMTMAHTTRSAGLVHRDPGGCAGRGDGLCRRELWRCRRHGSDPDYDDGAACPVGWTIHRPVRMSLA